MLEGVGRTYKEPSISMVFVRVPLVPKSGAVFPF